MRIVGALRRLVAETALPEILQRAKARDARFFAGLWTPLEALAVSMNGYDMVALKQTQPVRDLDSDYALLILGAESPHGLRTFTTEVGVSIMTGKKTWFLCEVDPFRTADVRLGNFGPIALPTADLVTVASRVAELAFEKCRLPVG
jgi:hypothetical protein